MSNIPKIIHYCWFGGAEEDPLIVACKESWARELPDYEIKRWDESNVDLKLPFLASWYRQKKWAFIADYVRLKALYDQGGIYLDTDIEVVRSFDPLLSHSAFVGEESPNRICNAVIGAVAGHSFLSDCIQYMEQQWSSGKSFKIGPEVIHSVMSQNSYDIEVLPCQSFYPYNPYDKSRPVSILLYQNVTAETYAIHHWNKSWGFSLWEKIKRKLGF